MKFTKKKIKIDQVGDKKTVWRYAWFPTRMTNGDVLWLESYNEKWEYVVKFNPDKSSYSEWDLKKKEENYNGDCRV